MKLLKSLASFFAGRPVAVTACCCLLALTVSICRLLDAGRDLWLAQKGAATQAIHEEFDKTRTWAGPLLAGIASGVNAQATEFRAEAGRQLGAVVAEAEQYRATADRQTTAALVEVHGLSDLLRPVTTAAVPVVEAAGEVVSQLQDTVGETNRTLAELHKTIADVHPQVLGLAAAGKVTLGETAQTMRNVRDAVPDLLKVARDTGAEVQAAAEKAKETSEHTAGIAANLETATKPLPKALRIILAVAPPTAQLAAGVVLLLQTLGIL